MLFFSHKNSIVPWIRQKLFFCWIHNALYSLQIDPIFPYSLETTKQKCSQLLKTDKTGTTIRAKRLCSGCVWTQVTLFIWFFWEARSELLPEISVSSIYAFVFLSGLWEWMTNDTEGSTSRSLKLWERFDLSLLLTCAISLHTYSNSWLNPSLFPAPFFHQCAFAFSLFDLYSRIKICCLYKGAI